MRNRETGRKEVKPLDPHETLWETGNRDLWQSELVSSDGIRVGRIIRQVIETQMFTIRYLVVYCPEHERHVLIPSDTLTEILPETVTCELTLAEIEDLPEFSENVSRSYELELYQSIQRDPYWVTEADWQRSETEEVLAGVTDEDSPLH